MNTETIKTREEVEALKQGWRNDPCFDLEDTEGFEEYRDELLAYSNEQKQKWAADFQKEVEQLGKPRSAAAIRYAYKEAVGAGDQLLREIAAQLADLNDKLERLITVGSDISVVR